MQTEHGLLDQLKNEYITDAHGAVHCASADASGGGHGGHGNVMIHVDEVAGLWFILAFTSGIGVAIAAGARARRWLRERASGGAQPRASGTGFGGGSAAGAAAAVAARGTSRFWGTTLSFGGKNASTPGSGRDPATPTTNAAPTPHYGGGGPPSPDHWCGSFASRLGRGEWGPGDGGGQQQQLGGAEQTRVEAFGGGGTAAAGAGGDAHLMPGVPSSSTA